MKKSNPIKMPKEDVINFQVLDGRDSNIWKKSYEI